MEEEDPDKAWIGGKGFEALDPLGKPNILLCRESKPRLVQSIEIEAQIEMKRAKVLGERKRMREIDGKDGVY